MEELIRIRIDELNNLRHELIEKQKKDLARIEVRIEELCNLLGVKGTTQDIPRFSHNDDNFLGMSDFFEEEKPQNVVASAPVEVQPHNNHQESNEDIIRPKITKQESDMLSGHLEDEPEVELPTAPEDPEAQTRTIESVIAAVDDILTQPPMPEKSPEVSMPPGLDELLAEEPVVPAKVEAKVEMPPGLDELFGEVPVVAAAPVAAPAAIPIPKNESKASQDDIEALLNGLV